MLFQFAYNVLLEKLNLGIAKFPMEIFPHGQAYFEYGIGGDSALTVHNNFIVGLDAKINRFKDHGLWYPGNADFYAVLKGTTPELGR